MSYIDHDLPTPGPNYALRGEGPVLLVALTGWNDAGEGASAALTELVQQFGAQQVAQFETQRFYDYQVNRPEVSVQPGGDRKLTWPTTTISQLELPGGPAIYLLQGTEPSLNWVDYTDEILAVASGLDVRTIICAGALLSDNPHTRPVVINASSDSAMVRERFDAVVSDYEGPTGIIGVLALRAHQAGFLTMSLWAGIPHYVANSPAPAASFALLERLASLLAVHPDYSRLIAQRDAWLETVQVLLEEDEEMQDYVRQLEESREAAEHPAATGEAIARDFEMFLRLEGEKKQPPSA